MLRLGFLYIRLLALWAAVFVVKYVSISFAGQVYRHFIDWPWYIDSLVVFVSTIIWFLVTSGFLSIFGISLYFGLTANLSKERYTKVSYEGEVTRGFFSDSVTLKPKVSTSSEYDDVNKFFGFVMLADMALLATGAIERFLVPQLMIW